ncbi:multidrug resistance efflux pump [Amycolatopsis jiangsuensis]|uniref:Multidrug resistance efflux pump n=1 Tax=Amycolatopsis jiangsuensis TaxID=1181879 RepID=A0A840IYD3_9PSEU|nr:multidrug resistance efflux pump [Amycolatopsis jiangsuensis]
MVAVLLTAVESWGRRGAVYWWPWGVTVESRGDVVAVSPWAMGVVWVAGLAWSRCRWWPWDVTVESRGDVVAVSP